LPDGFWADLSVFLDREADHGFVPASDRIFAALLRTECKDTKVVIVGQDPYPIDGDADGFAFSVPRGRRKPGSLVNIHRELLSDGFGPIPDHGCLEEWADNGVLLLNTALTTRKGCRRSHRRIWRPFTRAIIDIVDEADGAAFVLWGRDAQTLHRRLVFSRDRVVATAHPSRLSARKGFFESHPFVRANVMLEDLKKEPIDWTLHE
jgi:uracil-DNA glycosylase